MLLFSDVLSHYHPIPNEMESSPPFASALHSYGLTQKKTMVPNHLVEATTGHGSSVVVWSGSSSISCPAHRSKSAIRSYANSFQDHARNSCGLYIEHPDEGGLICHGSREVSLDRKSACPRSDVYNIRALPLVTLDELKHDHKCILAEADKVTSRIGNARALHVATILEDYDAAHNAFDAASRELLDLQDMILSSVVIGTRTARDAIQDGVPSKKQSDTLQRQSDALQGYEHAIDTLYSHSEELGSYITYMNNIVGRFNAMKKEIMSLGVE